MNVFEAVKQNVTTRQAAEMYGIRVNRHGMAVCPFHNDRNPSMKVDKRFRSLENKTKSKRQVTIKFGKRLIGRPFTSKSGVEMVQVMYHHSRISGPSR